MKKILLCIIAIIVLASSSFAINTFACATFEDVTFTNITNTTQFNSTDCLDLNDFSISPTPILFNGTIEFNSSVVACAISSNNITFSCNPVANGSTTVTAFVTNGSIDQQIQNTIDVAIPQTSSVTQPLSCSNSTIVDLTNPEGNTTETILLTDVCSGVTNHTISTITAQNSSIVSWTNYEENVSFTTFDTGVTKIFFTVNNSQESESMFVTINSTQYVNSAITLPEACAILNQQNLTNPEGNTTWMLNTSDLCVGNTFNVSNVSIANQTTANTIAYCQSVNNKSAVSCVSALPGNFTLNFTVSSNTSEFNYSVPFVITNYTSSSIVPTITDTCGAIDSQNLTNPEGNTTWLLEATDFCSEGFTISNVTLFNQSTTGPIAYCQSTNNNSAVSCISALTGNFTLNFTASSNTSTYKYSVPFVITNYTTLASINQPPTCVNTQYDLTFPDANTTMSHTINTTCTDINFDNISIVDFTNNYSTVSCSVGSDNQTISCTSQATGTETIYYTVSDKNLNTTATISVQVTSFTTPTNTGGNNNNNNGGTSFFGTINTGDDDDETNSSNETTSNNTRIVTNNDVNRNESIEIIEQINSSEQNQTQDNIITGQFAGEGNNGIIIGSIVLLLAIIGALVLFGMNRKKQKPKKRKKK